MATEFNNNITQMFSQLDNFVSTKTVVGEPISSGDVTLIPLIDVSFGMAGGATGDAQEKQTAEKSAGGMGASIKPSAVLVIANGNVQLVNIKHQDSINKLIDLIPSVTSKFDLKSLFSKKNEESTDEEVSLKK